MKHTLCTSGINFVSLKLKNRSIVFKKMNVCSL